MDEVVLSGAENVTWNLSDLFPDTERLKLDLDACLESARSFAKTYRGRVRSLDATGLALALQDLGSIQDTAGRAYTYAYLWWSTDTASADRGALLQDVKERYTQITTNLIFFELEWVAVSEDYAADILSEPPIRPFRHYLELQRASGKYLLSESEEKLLVEKSVTGRSAWNRYFDELLSDARFDMGGKSLTQQEILSKLHDSNRSTRQAAQKGFTRGLEVNLRSLAFIFNTILADKSTDDRLRNYPTWISDRNLSNEVDDDTVESLVDAVTDGYGIVSQYYEIKKRILGYEELYDYDRYAPVGATDTKISWSDAVDSVRDAYTSFHPEMGEIVDKFIKGKWIDAALRPNKRGGAFSHGAVPSTHPYILMNYTGRIRDVQTLAHELGHGVHQYLSRDQGIFHAGTPLTTAETASVFGEMLTFQKLLSFEPDPQNRLAMLMGKIDDTFATVFRQVSMNRFEHQVHTIRRTQGELSVEQFSEAWYNTQQAMFGRSVDLTDNYRIWWSYIPHFLHTPGYVYAYAFGELLVLALYEKYLEQGPSFADDYFDLLSAGGSDYPHVLLGKMGIDLQDKTFWKGGVQAIGRLVNEADSLSKDLNQSA